MKVKYILFSNNYILTRIKHNMKNYIGEKLKDQ